MSISSEELRTLHEKKGKIKEEGNLEEDGTGANNLKNITTALVENNIIKPLFKNYFALIVVQKDCKSSYLLQIYFPAYPFVFSAVIGGRE